VSVVRLPSGEAIADPQWPREDEFAVLQVFLDKLDQVSLETALEQHPEVLDYDQTSSDEECGAYISEVGRSPAKEGSGEQGLVCPDIGRIPAFAEMAYVGEDYVYAYHASSPGRHFGRYYVLTPAFTVFPSQAVGC